MTALHIIGGRPSAHTFLILIGTGTGISVISKTTVISVAAITILGTASVLTLFHDLLVSLLHFFEFFFSLILIRIIDIGIRVILSAQLPVCLFYFIIRCVSGNSQHTVWI